jgi:hypothetical protein
MPKIVGDRRVEPLDVWDCLFYGGYQQYHGPRGEGPLVPGQRLFGNANVGNLSFTNLQIPGQLGADQCALVTNWYARTNIPDGAPLQAMSEMAMCTLIVGCMPQRQEPLSALLRRGAARARGENVEFAAKEAEQTFKERIELVETVAEQLYCTHRREVKRSTTTADALANAERGDAIPVEEHLTNRHPWQNVKDEAERGRWLAVAAHAVAMMKPQSMIVIPTRQNFSVQVDMFGSALAEFNTHIKRLDEPNWDHRGERVSYLQRPPGHPSDRPGLWIHLEGWFVRDWYER